MLLKKLLSSLSLFFLICPLAFLPLPFPWFWIPRNLFELKIRFAVYCHHSQDFHDFNESSSHFLSSLAFPAEVWYAIISTMSVMEHSFLILLCFLLLSHDAHSLLYNKQRIMLNTSVFHLKKFFLFSSYNLFYIVKLYAVLGISLKVFQYYHDSDHGYKQTIIDL